MTNQNSTRAKALLAITFASGIFAAPAAMAESTGDAREALIQRLVTKAEVPPEVRAYYFLQLALYYLKPANGNSGEYIIQPLSNPKYASELFTRRADHRGRNELRDRLEYVARETHTHSEKVAATPETGVAQKVTLAKQVLKLGVADMDKSSDPAAKLILHYVTSQIYQQMDNKAGQKTYSSLLEQDIRACEAAPQANEKLVTAAAMVLNAMAYALIPFDPSSQMELLSHAMPNLRASKEKYTFTENDFKQSELLKLRAAALADRLSSTSDLRRMTHRDLALWYKTFDKTDLADKQKQSLFELVGTQDERILFPQHGMCGSLIWWHAETLKIDGGCGMG